MWDVGRIEDGGERRERCSMVKRVMGKGKCRRMESKRVKQKEIAKTYDR